MVAVVVYVVVAVACNGSGGCICGSGCCMWWWQLHVMVAVDVYVRAGGMLSYPLRPLKC